MRWDAVAIAIGQAAANDATLLEIYGAANIRQKAAAQDHLTPGLGFWLVTDAGTELWEPQIWQWDQWCDTWEDLVASERALRKLFDHDLEVTIQGVYMFSVFTEGAELTDDPDRAGFYGRAVRFRYSPIREDLRCGRSP